MINNMDYYEEFDEGGFNEDAPFSMQEEFEEIGSQSTMQGSQGGIGKRVSNYTAVEDKSIFVAHQARCCLCGVTMAPNKSNTCVTCLKSQIDITEGIQKQVNIIHCKECDRWKKPPWTIMDPESPQMLAYCLKQVKGFTKKVKLVDSGFVWTEPHSKKLKVKATI